jgi:hypothetical protein
MSDLEKSLTLTNHQKILTMEELENKLKTLPTIKMSDIESNMVNYVRPKKKNKTIYSANVAYPGMFRKK